jgi:hypothetical protein
MNQHIERVELKEFAELIRESFRQLFRLATRRKGLAYAKHRFVALRVRSQRRKHTHAHIRFRDSTRFIGPTLTKLMIQLDYRSQVLISFRTSGTHPGFIAMGANESSE